MPTTLGRVTALYRYPVKSMAAESLDEVSVSWAGIDGDRRWAFVRGGMERSNFPWLTIREKPTLWHYRPRFVDPSRPNDSMTFVRTPDGRDLDVVDPALAEELGHDCHVIKQGRGVFDTMPLSLISTRTIAQIGAITGRTLHEQRFRPNIVFEPATDGPFVEDGAVGHELTIGELKMRVDKRDQRCVMVNVDPSTTEKDPSVLRAIAQHRDACLGVYGTTVTPGHIRVGDVIMLV